MFTLVAASRKPILDGVVATRRFDTLSDAEAEMRNWALFGIDNQCNEADAIYICDAKNRLLRTWHWARKQAVSPG
ncbi:MAG: hypothetical protein ACK4MS_13560 [Paracoccaceae bacterium]